MSIFYKLFQSKRKNSKYYDMWYARAYPLGTKTLKDIAEVIQRNASVKKSDVMAVLTELPEVMNDMLSDGYRVKIDNFGAFKVGITTKPATSPKEFSAAKNITGSKINFTPTTERTGSGGTRVRSLASNLEYRQWGDKQADKEEEIEP